MIEIPLEDFFDAYYECRQNKRRTTNQLSFELSYEDNLADLYNEVNSFTYEIGESICFCVTRPKLREIFAADFRDRVVHHLVMQRLEPLFESVFIYDNYNCRLEKGVLFGVKRLQEQMQECIQNTKDCYVCTMDMKGFFMSINKQLLWDKLKDFIQKNYKREDIDILLYLVKKIVLHEPQKKCIVKGKKELFAQLPKDKSLFTCKEGFGMAIGNLTSQVFANFFLNDFDIAMRDKYNYYGRYVDDLYVIGEKKKVLESIKFARHYLKENLGICLNEKKVYIQPYYHGVKFIGHVIKSNRIYTANRTINNIFERLHRLNNNVKPQNAEHFMQTMNSYFGFLKHTKSYSVIRNICDSINIAWLEWCTLVNFKKIQLRKHKLKKVLL